jgi:hypothetical protein
MKAKDEEELFGLFHELAELAPDELNHRWDDQTFFKVRSLVEQAYGEPSYPESLDAKGISDWLKGLRSNERDWSRHLGDLILASETAVTVGEIQQARETLAEFAVACPWHPYRKIALNQLQSMH